MTVIALLALVSGIVVLVGNRREPNAPIDGVQAIGYCLLFGGIGTLLFHGF